MRPVVFTAYIPLSCLVYFFACPDPVSLLMGRGGSSEKTHILIFPPFTNGSGDSLKGPLCNFFPLLQTGRGII